jgi:hypothetical protein
MSRFARYGNVGYTNSISVEGEHNSTTYQYSNSYYRQPDKLIVWKDMYGGDNGDVIKVTFNGDCGSTTLSTRIIVNSTKTTIRQTWGAGAVFWKYEQCYYDWWTGAITRSYYYNPTSWYGYFSITPYYTGNCTYYRVLKDGVPLTGFVPMTSSYSLSYSGAGFSLSSGYIAIYTDTGRAAWPNNSHTVTLEIYSNFQEKNNFNSASKSSATWTVTHADAPNYTSMYGSVGRMNLRTGTVAGYGCNGWYNYGYYGWWYNYYYRQYYYQQRRYNRVSGTTDARTVLNLR